MKNILIITSQGSKAISWNEREQYIQQFCHDTQALLNDADVMYTTYTDIVVVINDKGVVFIDTKNNKKLCDYDFIQFKNWHGNLELASVIARYCKESNIPFVNKEVAVEINIGKLAQAYVLKNAGIPVPSTMYIMSEKLEGMSDDEIASFGFTLPYIVKQVDGSMGRNNYLCNSYDELRTIVEQDSDKQFLSRPQYVIQEFIPNDGDYRVLYIGSELEPFVFLRKAVNGSHLNNTSQGGSGGVVDTQDLPKVYLDHARKSAKALKCDVAGVDIIVNRETGQHYILEVNSTPAIATGFMVDQKTRKFADYIEVVTNAEELDEA